MDISHNREAHRFETRIEDSLARLDYELKDGTMYIMYVEVPPRFRGQGIAASLVDHAVQFANSQQQSVIPICSFAAAHLRRRDR